MRIFKGFLKVVAILVFAACVNGLINFVLEPYGSKSQIMWTDYRQEEDIDMVFFGTSIAERSFDPRVIDAECGANSFNMSTPAQMVEESFIALKTACADHDLKMVVYGLEYSNLQGTNFPNPGRAFLHFKNQGNPAAAISDTLWCLSNPRCYTTTSSINWMFPWIENRVKLSPSILYSNVRMKLDGTSVYEAAAVNERGWTYYGKGYGNYDRAMDYNEGVADLYRSSYGRRSFDEQKLQTLASICDYCVARDIEFVVVVSPLPVYNIFDLGDKYFDQSEQIRQLVEAHGGAYYDFNLARPELLDTSNTEYYDDGQHLSTKGGAAVSSALVTVLKTRDAGGNTDQLFYGSKEEFQAAKNYIDLVLLNASVVDEGVRLKATALAGSTVEAEFQFCVQDPQAKEWVEIRGWSTENSFVYNPGEAGIYKFKVNARQVGSDVEYDRYRTKTITYGGE